MTEVQNRFFSKLNALSSGERAALRREAGKPIYEADAKAVTTFYACLPHEVPDWAENRWYAVACLRCIWDAGKTSDTPFEQVLGRLIKNKTLTGSIKHRIDLLLDTEWDDDGYLEEKLARMVKLVRQKSERATFDFSALLDDLLHWNADKQYVQRKWAKAIYGTNDD
ncbi:MAG: type I-E CRISPR-associated protein Cse2/CasB [Lachnospiraceae bacterium]|nr:type I-E CRISPR-associated protein Cse2/CasB [Lachnospiraceae bacterium]